ncbi:MAG: hypothetical protein IPI33_17145 [Dehalococcoidia bacterium]|nr:hypothetical protein [Dehalococcoidia bacterium]
MNETELIAAARTSPDAFASLYDLTQPGVYRYAYSLAGNHTGAEDLTAEAYRRALVNLHRYEDRGRPFEAWLCTIVRNLARDGGRKRGREIPADGPRPTTRPLAGFRPGPPRAAERRPGGGGQTARGTKACGRPSLRARMERPPGRRRARKERSGSQATHLPRREPVAGTPSGGRV